MRKWIVRQLVRFTHIAVCLAIMLPLLLCPSALHRMIFNGTERVHGVLYLVFFTATLAAYLIASLVDPGYLTHAKARLFRHRRGHMSDCGSDEFQYSTPDGQVTSGDVRITSNDPTGANVFATTVSILDTQTNDALPYSRCDWRTFFGIPDIPPCPASKNSKLYEEYVLNLPVPIRFCRHCLLEQPLRCRHCPDCQRCVIKFDHHCPWIANCVGERNHSAFVVFLMFQTVLLWWTMYLAWSSIIPHYMWADWMRLNALFLVEIVLLMIIGIPLTILLGFHTYLALASKTTWETIAYEKITYLQQLDDHSNPFNQGLARNCFTFCCSRYPLGWDQIYADAVLQKNGCQPADPSPSLTDLTTQPRKDPAPSADVVITQLHSGPVTDVILADHSVVGGPMNSPRSPEGSNSNPSLHICSDHSFRPGA